MRGTFPSRSEYAAFDLARDWRIAALIAFALAASPLAALATPVISAANIPYSGVAPGGIDMSTGEIIIVCRPELALGGAMPLVFTRYYGSMIAREGLASGHLGTNWLGNFDWSLAVGPAGATVVTDRGQRIEFGTSPLGGYDLVSPTDEKYRLDLIGGSLRFTYPSQRRVYAFDGTSLALTTIYDEHGNSLSLTYAAATGRLSQVSDGLGRALTFGYDPGGLLTQVSDGTRSVTYGHSGNLLTSATDAAGQTTNYAYAAPAVFPGLIQSVTEPLGNVPASCAYDPLGRVATMTDAFAHTSSCSYDTPSGNTWTDALGHTWTFVHDASNHLVGLIDPGPVQRSFSYDALGRLASMTRPLGDVTTFSYDAASGLPASLTLGDGSVFVCSYSSHAAGGGAFYDLAGVTFPDGHTESFTRDAAGNLTDWLDRGGFHWLGTYNPRGQMLTATNPAGGVSTLTYDPQGRLASATDNAGHTTNYAFDAFDRLTQRTKPPGPPSLFAHDALDHLTSFTDELGKVWTFAYDANGRALSETDPLLAQSTFSYDNADRLIQATDPLGHASMFAYDAAGRLASFTDRTGNATQYQYDAPGRLTRRLDPSGAPVIFAYDANGRLPAVQDALGHTAQFQYDALDRVTHTIDPLGVGRDYGYDPMGRLISALEPLGHTMSMTYDARGLLASFFDVTSETDFARTPLGQVSQVTDPNRHGWPATYDLDGRMSTVADPLARTTSLTYDALGRLAHIQRPIGTEDIGYDPANRVLARNFSDGTLFGYSWDDADRLAGGSGAAIGYDAAGRMTSSNGLTFTHDAEGRITSETYAPGKVVTYTYDSRGLVKTVTDWIGGTTSFGYDTTGALIALLRPDLTSASYAYDAAGRVAQQIENKPPPSGSPLSSIAITRDALGRPTSINRSQPLMPAVGASGSTVFSYDAASQINGLSWDPLGRLMGDGSRTFSWDGASRLTGFASGAESPAFTYDAFGSPLSRTQGAATEQYLWNYGRESPTLDMRSQGGTPQTYFIYTPDGMLLHSIDAASGARNFYHYDENGNAIFLTDGTGAVTTKYAYTPSGSVAMSGPASSNPFTFGGAGGAMQIGSSGLYRMGGEIYDAMTSRLISGGATESGTGFFKSVTGLKSEQDASEFSEGGVHGSSHRSKPPPNGSPMGSPGDWVMTRPPPQNLPMGSPGDWVMNKPPPSGLPMGPTGPTGRTGQPGWDALGAVGPTGASGAVDLIRPTGVYGPSGRIAPEGPIFLLEGVYGPTGRFATVGSASMAFGPCGATGMVGSAQSPMPFALGIGNPGQLFNWYQPGPNHVEWADPGPTQVNLAGTSIRIGQAGTLGFGGGAGCGKANFPDFTIGKPAGRALALVLPPVVPWRHSWPFVP